MIVDISVCCCIPLYMVEFLLFVHVGVPSGGAAIVPTSVFAIKEQPYQGTTQRLVDYADA